MTLLFEVICPRCHKKQKWQPRAYKKWEIWGKDKACVNCGCHFVVKSDEVDRIVRCLNDTRI